jgi:hypothetical protein
MTLLMGEPCRQRWKFYILRETFQWQTFMNTMMKLLVQWKWGLINSFFFNSHSGGSTRHVGHWMAYCTCPGWLWWLRIWWNEDWQGKPKYSEKTCPSANLSTTNPTWPDPGANPVRRGGKPATYRFCYGATLIKMRAILTNWETSIARRIKSHNTESEDRWNSKLNKNKFLICV